jgi:acetoin utilization deacetylase AcuC-like enzyme
MLLEVNVVYSERHKLHHDPWNHHPESPWRVEEVMRALGETGLIKHVKLMDAPPPDYSAVLLAHSSEYVEWLREECKRGFHYIDPDTYVNEHSCDVAASFATAARDYALRALNEGGVWVILARPGGHHAGRSGRAMGAPTLGFCLFDYTSIAALTALNAGGRVVALDFDAHHGNGSQEILWREPCIVHVDIHEWGIYPGTGWVTDMGGPGAEGTKINVPLNRGAGDREFAWSLLHVVKPVVDIAKPDILVVFAGFDAHELDPLTGLEASDDTYKLFGSYINELVRSERVRGVVVILGGGYGRGLVSGFTSFIKALMGFERAPQTQPRSPGDHVERYMPEILRLLEKTLSACRAS